YDRTGKLVTLTSGLTERFPGLNYMPTVPVEITQHAANQGEFRRVKSQNLFIYALPLTMHQEPAGTLSVVYDAGYINVQSRSFWWGTFLLVAVQVFLIAMVVLFIVRWSISGPIARTVQWMRALRTGKGSLRHSPEDGDLFMPLRDEVTTLVQSLAAARESAEKRPGCAKLWSPPGPRSGWPCMCAPSSTPAACS